MNYAAIQDARIFTCHQVLYYLGIFPTQDEAVVRVLTELLRVFSLFLYLLINLMDFFF